MFQSLSGLTLGLNQGPYFWARGGSKVSIPFRADTGFEHERYFAKRAESIGFQSLSGLTLGLNLGCPSFTIQVPLSFQSLSGLSLGLKFYLHKGAEQHHKKRIRRIVLISPFLLRFFEICQEKNHRNSFTAKIGQ